MGVEPSATALIKPLLQRTHLALNGRRYEDLTYVNRGGSGEVYRAQIGDQIVAVKVFFPFYERRQLELLQVASTQMPAMVATSLEFQRREYRFISRISHPNIVRAHDAGTFVLSGRETAGIRRGMGLDGIREVPLLVSEFVEGLPLDRAIDEYRLTPAELAYALGRVAEALDHLHVRHSYLHTDIKPSNVLIRADIREPVLIDFALSKNFDFGQVDRNEETKLLGDRDLFPRNLPDDHPIERARRGGATREEIKRLALPALDLFQFGQMLRTLTPQFEAVFEQRERRYLAVLIYELDDWERVSAWHAGELARRVRRLSPTEAAPFGVAVLAAPGVPEHTLVLPGAVVPLARRVEPIVRSGSFRRLGTVNQLSLVSLVYPGADYKRQVHVLYAYELARQLVAHLYASPRFRYYFDEMAVEQLLVTVLLHDINHFPFLHTFQESKVPGLKAVELFDLLCDGRLTGERNAGEPSVYELLEQHGLSAARFKRLVQGSFEDQRDEIDQISSSIINSGVDVDKLSYLRLDAYFTGVPYGGAVDIPALMKAATIAPVDGRFHLAFGSRSLVALEHVVFTRYWNFRTIYWHHTNRALMAMVLSVVRHLYTTREGVERYIRQTAMGGDLQAIRFLDQEFREREQRPSILHGIERDRSIIYKRLHTLNPAASDGDRTLYRQLHDLDQGQEAAFRARLAAILSERLTTPGRPVEVAVADVLVDIPRRPLDMGGSIYVETKGGRRELLSDVSRPVGFLRDHYAELSQQTRLFVAPWVRRALLTARRELDPREATKMIRDGLEHSAGPDELR